MLSLFLFSLPSPAAICSLSSDFKSEQMQWELSASGKANNQTKCITTRATNHGNNGTNRIKIATDKSATKDKQKKRQKRNGKKREGKKVKEK